MVGSMDTWKVNFRLPEDLIRKADTIARVQHKTRTDIIKEALQQYLQEAEKQEELKQTVMELYLDGEIIFETLSRVIGRRDAAAVRTSKKILEEEDKLADDLASLGASPHE